MSLSQYYYPAGVWSIYSQKDQVFQFSTTLLGSDTASAVQVTIKLRQTDPDSQAIFNVTITTATDPNLVGQITGNTFTVVIQKTALLDSQAGTYVASFNYLNQSGKLIYLGPPQGVPVQILASGTNL